AFKRQIFDYLKEGEELVEEPFQRLIRLEQLTALRYRGFWACMDTFKDKQAFDDMSARGETPWELWKSAEGSRAPTVSVTTRRLAQLIPEGLPRDSHPAPQAAPRAWPAPAMEATRGESGG